MKLALDKNALDDLSKEHIEPLVQDLLTEGKTEAALGVLLAVKSLFELEDEVDFVLAKAMASIINLRIQRVTTDTEAALNRVGFTKARVEQLKSKFEN